MLKFFAGFCISGIAVGGFLFVTGLLVEAASGGPGRSADAGMMTLAGLRATQMGAAHAELRSGTTQIRADCRGACDDLIVHAGVDRMRLTDRDGRCVGCGDGGAFTRLDQADSPLKRTVQP